MWSGRSKWTVVALAAVTLALAGCGRKGGLDLPPQAGVQAETEIATPRAPGTVFDPNFGGDRPPEAQVRADRAKRGFILDPLLGN